MRKSETKTFALAEIVLGIAIGISSALFLVWILDANLSSKLEDRIVGICTSIATLVAAYLALRGISKQIQLQQKMAEEKRISDLEAEKAALALALSRVVSICRQGIQEAAGLDNVEFEDLELDGLTLEPTHIESIKASIRLTEGRVRSCLKSILLNYQIALSRQDPEWKLTTLTKAPDEATVDDIQKHSSIVYWAYTHMLADMLFDFARDKAEFLPEHYSSEYFEGAPVIAGIQPEQFTGLSNRLERRAQELSTQKIQDT